MKISQIGKIRTIRENRNDTLSLTSSLARSPSEREFIGNLLVRIHLIIEMVLVDRPCAMDFSIPFSR